MNKNDLTKAFNRLKFGGVLFDQIGQINEGNKGEKYVQLEIDGILQNERYHGIFKGPGHDNVCFRGLTGFDEDGIARGYDIGIKLRGVDRVNVVTQDGKVIPLKDLTHEITEYLFNDEVLHVGDLVKITTDSIDTQYATIEVIRPQILRIRYYDRDVNDFRMMTFRAVEIPEIEQLDIEIIDSAVVLKEE